jgi:DNA polymerase III delta subunit
MTNKEEQGVIMLITGTEDFLIKERFHNLQKASEDKYGEFNVLTVTLGPEDKSRIKLRSKEIASELLTPAFFGSKRVIFLENFPPSKGLFNKDDDKYLVQILKAIEDLPEGNVVVISAVNPDQRTKLYKTLVKIAKVETFNELKEGQLTDWILTKISQLGGKMLPAAASFLANYCGNDLWKINQEVKKLANWADTKPISEADIQKICLPHDQMIPFAFSNALQSADWLKALEILQQQIAMGIAPQVVLMRDLAPIVRSIVNVQWATANNLDAKAIKMNPWVFSRWRSIASKFESHELKAMLQGLVKIDQGLKTGKIDASGGELRLFSLTIEYFLLEFFASKNSSKQFTPKAANQ